MRVLNVVALMSQESGGLARSVQGFVAGLCQAGVDAWVWPLDGTEPWIPGVRKYTQALSTQTLKRFDIVHIHGIWDLGLHKVTAMCRKAGVKYVIAPRGMLEPWSLKQKWIKKRIARWLYQDRDLRLAAALHATAESEAEQFRALGFRNKIIVSPNGVNVPEKGTGNREQGTGGKSEKWRANSSIVGRRALAEKKVEEWLTGVTEESFRVALEKLVDEKVAAGECRFNRGAERVAAIKGAKKFFDQFARKIVQLSDGRCVYFVPDARAKNRNKDNARSWAEYAFHAVSNGGARIQGKGYNERLYNPHKAANFNLIETTLRSERCYVRLDSDSRYDAIMFDGGVVLGLAFQVVARLDVCGNIEANLTEVTFTSSSKRVRKTPRLVALAEAVQAVVHHQTTPGSCPQDSGIIPNRSPLRNRGRRVLFVSRMHPKKGVLELVESWARVFKAKGEGEQWCCELVYTVNGPEEKAYEQKVKQRIIELGMSYVEGQRSKVKGQTEDGRNHCRTSGLGPQTSSPDFIFTGALDDEKKWEAYGRADLFVLPTYSENFGIVVAEALWAGVPVITTKGAPWAELEETGEQRPGNRGRCGWWIDLPEAEVERKGGEWNALDNALREAMSLPVTSDQNMKTDGRYLCPPPPLSSPSLKEMGARGHQLVAERYIWKAICAKMAAEYKNLPNVCRGLVENRDKLSRRNPDESAATAPLPQRRKV